MLWDDCQAHHSRVMADQLQAWRAWFWDADFWLPENTTWQRLDETKNPKWVQSGELFLCFPIAVLLIVLRFVFERLVVRVKFTICSVLMVNSPAFQLAVSSFKASGK